MKVQVSTGRRGLLRSGMSGSRILVIAIRLLRAGVSLSRSTPTGSKVSVVSSEYETSKLTIAR